MKKFKIVTAMLIALVIVFSMFVPSMKVFAFADTNKISVSFRDGYTSSQGKVQYSLDDGASWVDVTSDITDQSITMAGDNLKIKIVPENGYEVDFTGIELYEESTKIEGTGALIGNGYQVDAEAKNVSLLYVEFRTTGGGSGGDDPIDQPASDEVVSSMRFRLNGQDISADFTQQEPQVQVSSNMNFDELNEFYITEIVTNKKTYTYIANQYGLNLKDDKGGTVLETNFTKQTSNLAYLRVETHVNTIKESDLTAMNKEREDFCEFYMPQLKLIKPVVNGTVELSTAHMPDVYDFVSFNGIELGDTSINNFGEVTVYYGDDTIDLSGMGCNITNIELVEGKGVLKSAVDIDVANKKVKVKSNYYNEIPLKVTAEVTGGNEVVGYINVSRVGIYIGTLNKGSNVFYHGATNGNVNANGGNLKVDTDKHRIVAVFYHDNTETIDDYDIIVNIVNKDGTTETKLAKPVGDVNDLAGTLVGSDFILWEGDSVGERPSKISATAVKKGATSNTTIFGGATFGAGAGVTWVNAE